MTSVATASAAQMHGAAATRAAYRPDIDGLRAVSVLAVILFHAGVPGITGGFVGVDVFFVISGFLITRLLLEDPGRPLRTRLADFYVRRARRILPALLVVMWAATLGAWWLFSPTELQGFGRFLAACAAMLANVAAWSLGGYFDTPWAMTPLLHYWSIAVEEQFYLLYPAALLLLQRMIPHHWRMPVIGAAALASLGVCIWASYAHPAANYYALPSRAWELLLGAGLALGAVPRVGGRMLTNLLALLALATILACCVIYDNRTRYPGICTLAPALGTAVLIVTGRVEGSWGNRMLAAGPLVFVGLTSYSLYLWHVPVLTLFGYFNIVPVSPLQKSALLATIALLAVASWAWIERPIRARRVLRNTAAFAWTALAASMVTIASGLWLAHSDGFPRRFPPEVRRILDHSRLFAESGTGCMGLTPAAIDAGAFCKSGITQNPESTFLVWGDSHAWALLPALEANARQRHAQVLFAAWPACRPLPGVGNETRSTISQARCAEFNAAMLRAVRRLEPEVLVLHAQWMFGETPGAPAGGIERGLRALANGLPPGQKICVVQSVPIYPYSVPNALAIAELRGIDTGFIALRRSEVLRLHSGLDAAFRAVIDDGLMRGVDPKRQLCPLETCRLRADDGMPLYRDSNHLSVSGALLLAPELSACLR